MSMKKADRLKEARIAAGFRSAQAAAEANEWTASTYRSHENGTRDFDVEDAKRYGRAFKVNPGHLLALDTTVAKMAHIADTMAERSASWLEITGVVAAGIWREHFDLPPEERTKIEVQPLPHAARPYSNGRFLVALKGLSMNKTIPDGSVLDCVRVEAGLEPQHMDLVIVERRRHDLAEMTCKRYVVGSDGIELWPESTLPEFQAPIRIKELREQDDLGDEIRVIGVVIEARQLLFRQDVQRQGLLN